MAEDSPAPEPTASPRPEIGPTAEEEPWKRFQFLPDPLVEARRRLEAEVAGLEFHPFSDRLEVLLLPAQLVETCSVIRDDLGYRMLMSITAVDWKTSFELIYHLYRLDSPYPLILRCSLPHEEEPRAPTIVPLWAGADFQEREIYDLMGIVFTGHPYLRRILLDDDFPGHPLRKDFQPDPDYVLVRHLRIPGYPGAQPGVASTGRFPSD